ncbi:NUDIX domain-containing protein [Winogradskyella alexanderae]|uniref:GDP-mannose pyrophosphatase n=1 Tax=Winogradskyella alexanderae TaxID=2877123 RepID=A0ABS7XRJ9_9FLAO|nr:NUDIX domain-containing protein [Winogradskyella alexanderae]MCA0132649.1 NUDIX domain-containing protein [Winogradskyella alexanderae]
MKNLRNIEHIKLSKAWAQLDRIDYDFKFKNGEWKRLSRETYNRGDGAAILLYNVKNGTVILTRQFRMPIYENNKNEGMSIEVCAGAIDKSDSPIDTIIAEVEEEVGYKIETAKHVLSAYTSPGALTEKMFLYVAEYSAKMKISDGGGLASENEEIEVLELPFNIVLKMVEDQEIIDAKSIMLIQYAQINNLLG